MTSKKTDCLSNTDIDYTPIECKNIDVHNHIEGIKYFFVTKSGKKYMEKAAKHGMFFQDELDRLCASGDIRFEVIYKQH